MPICTSTVPVRNTRLRARDLLIVIFRVVLFIGLFLISIRFIHTYPQPMPFDQLQKLYAISEKLSIRDPGDLYVSALLIVNICAAAVEYKLLILLWGKYRRRRGTRGLRDN